MKGEVRKERCQAGSEQYVTCSYCKQCIIRYDVVFRSEEVEEEGEEIHQGFNYSNQGVTNGAEGGAEKIVQ